MNITCQPVQQELNHISYSNEQFGILYTREIREGFELKEPNTG
jgi:hypothetical protein